MEFEGWDVNLRDGFEGWSARDGFEGWKKG